MLRQIAWAALALTAVASGVSSAAFGLPAAPRTILDLQGHSEANRVAIVDSGRDVGQVRLLNLNVNIGAWYLVEIQWPGPSELVYYHIENPFPSLQTLRLANPAAGGLVLTRGARTETCALWTPSRLTSKIEAAGSDNVPFVPLCDGWIFLRNKTEGQLTSEEMAVDFLRTKVAGGEELVNLVKTTVYKDRELITAPIESGDATVAQVNVEGAPAPAAVDKRYERSQVKASWCGDIKTVTEPGGSLGIGRWYPTKANSRVFFSPMLPDAVPDAIQRSHPDSVGDYDDVERKAFAFLVAFDLSRFEVGYANGTRHPDVAYSERAPANAKVAGWSGPDGIGSAEPLVATGMVNPIEAKRVVATFIGGFKRKHSAFRVGAWSKSNGANHYGFLQNGVLFSTLHEGLSTAVMTKDGQFELKTWTKADNDRLGQVRFARQNGLPMVEWDGDKKEPVPNRYVKRNYEGNWSGSSDHEVRALRSGICWQSGERGNFLVFGYFTSHTPNSMTRIFQAYGCRHAMHLDMNMAQHTYLALFDRSRGEAQPPKINHIIPAMAESDGKYRGTSIPRFVGIPDNRDFFYVMERAAPRHSPPEVGR